MHLTQATILEALHQGRLDLALSHCTLARSLYPSEAWVWRISAQLAASAGQFDTAVNFMSHASALAPCEVPTRLQYCALLLGAGKRFEALTEAQELRSQEVASPQHQDCLGTLLTQLEEPRLGLEHFERAVASCPENASFRFNLAMAQRMTGNLTAAETNLDAVISVRPDDGDAYLARSDLRVQTPERNHVAELQDALRRLPAAPASIPIRFAMAKELEDLQRFEESFSYVTSANNQVRRRLAYDVSHDVAALESIRRSHTLSRLQFASPSACERSCIFVVGLPRSGTSLLELALSRHSRVRAGGEIPAFTEAVVTLSQGSPAGKRRKIDLIESSLACRPEALAQEYFSRARYRIGDAACFTDKQPLNYLYVGLILRSIAGAKIVLVERDPIDSCYAMYKTLFRDGFPFTYALEDLSRYYSAWHALMRHWEQVAGNAMLRVRYEHLLSNPEHVLRNVLRHCGLDWEANCLQPHASLSAVTTASAAQVRRPFYQTSVGLWRRYAKQLQPLIDSLTAAGIAHV